MNYRRTSFVAHALGRTAAAVSLSILLAVAVSPQQSPGSSAPANGAPSPKGESRDRELREAELRKGLAEADMEQARQRRLLAAIEQVKQDFRRIQIIRNEMVDDLVAKKPLDYKRISEQAGEVNKRALRLKTYLIQSMPEEKGEGKEKEQKKPSEFNGDEMKGALVKLCNLIFSFTENPALKNPGTADAQQSIKAGGDLLDIVELSADLQRSAERLRKTAK